ncbi:MAG: methyltransferase domain-containing protein [Gammaproteobacteria bacterium]|nr:methyltransferase domain-containing protein [Gammaproteobacteria bacterium]MBU1645125.1 methyltransferase domain-containing protein [Gammaproteobacteria bacterium]MBU1973362.1 methyltransferase domain-containing protein [Gammaproteobacteria bacterium]
MKSAVILLVVVLALPVAAQERSLSPGVNRAYDGADYRRWQGMFETEGREVFDKRHEIVAALGIRPGMAVADVGAGTGAFTALLSQKVGAGGTAIAQDISPEFLRGIEARTRRENLVNVRTVQGGEKDAGLSPASLDLIFLCDTYHHFEYPQAMLASLRAALKPGGRLAVIDYEKIPGRSSAWVMGHVRAGREAAIAEIEAAGFRLLKSHSLLSENFFLEFERQ